MHKIWNAFRIFDQTYNDAMSAAKNTHDLAENTQRKIDNALKHKEKIIVAEQKKDPYDFSFDEDTPPKPCKR